MPEDGLPAIPRDDLLTPAEIARLVGIGVHDLGIREVRFTGGEPLMRADLAEIIGLSHAAAPGIDISITTNGIGLDHRLSALVAAGLNRVNISLDTVDRDHFAALTRRDRLPAVLRRGRRGARCGPHTAQAQRRDDARDARRRPRPPGLGDRARVHGCGSSSRCRSTPTAPGCART